MNQPSQPGSRDTQWRRETTLVLFSDACLAGIWANFAHRERNILEPGDVEEGLNAATQIGDDRMQMRAQGYVVPESFNHGSADQRVRWFRRGIETGDLKQCDTFSTRPVS